MGAGSDGEREFFFFFLGSSHLQYSTRLHQRYDGGRCACRLELGEGLWVGVNRQELVCFHLARAAVFIDVGIPVCDAAVLGKRAHFAVDSWR